MESLSSKLTMLICLIQAQGEDGVIHGHQSGHIHLVVAEAVIAVTAEIAATGRMISLSRILMYVLQ